MLPIFAEKIPTSSEELADALTRGLQKHNVTAESVEARGAFPSIEKLSVDVTGAELTRDLRAPGALVPGGTTLEIADFELLGAPVYAAKAPLEMRVAGGSIRARLQLDGPDGWLILESAATGTLFAQISRESLESLLQTLAAEAASKHGVEVRRTKLDLTQEGPRTVSFRAEVTAKMFVMTASVALTGLLEIDDELNARLSRLKLDGDKMILAVAGGFARPHLDRLEGQSFPLRQFAPGGLHLRHVELTAGDTLAVRAQFGAV